MASERDRQSVAVAVREGLESGCVQPIEGARAYSSPTVANLDDFLSLVARSGKLKPKICHDPLPEAKTENVF